MKTVWCGKDEGGRMNDERVLIGFFAAPGCASVGSLIAQKVARGACSGTIDGVIWI
jgi:hypothetical protein